MTTSRPAKSSARQTRPSTRPKPSFRFVNDVVSELKKVTWPSRKEAMNLTAIVLIVSASIGALLGLVDLVFSQLITLLLLR